MTVFSDAMREALRLTRAGELRDATRVIRQALRQADAGSASPDPAPSSSPGPATAYTPARFVALEPIPLPSPPPAASPHANAPAAPRPPKAGHDIAGTFSNAAGTRSYKLWVPSRAAQGHRLPLVVMLHGCTQDADDFARGTRMNAHAERLGCYVLYPVQDGSANAQRCWRWFEATNQQREGAEPSLLAGMTRQVIAEHGIDPERVYVAGLSAGGAMAMVLGHTHPDIFAAVAVHSGLPVGAAHDVASAFAAMAGRSQSRSARDRSGSPARPMPGIVFHGDADRTVRACNGDAVVQQLTERYANAGQALRRTAVVAPTHTSARFHAADGRLVIEQWSVNAAGHAWSGGAAAGSHTAPEGPDASARMIEFFLSHSRRD